MVSWDFISFTGGCSNIRPDGGTREQVVLRIHHKDINMHAELDQNNIIYHFYINTVLPLWLFDNQPTFQVIMKVAQ